LSPSEKAREIFQERGGTPIPQYPHNAIRIYGFGTLAPLGYDTYPGLVVWAFTVPDFPEHYTLGTRLTKKVFIENTPFGGSAPPKSYWNS